MFGARKLGGYLSRLRKNADMTQFELAGRLTLTRQAVSALRDRRKLSPCVDPCTDRRYFPENLDGEMDWYILCTLIPYMNYIQPQIEVAVVEGILPCEALDVMREGNRELWKRQQKNGEL